MNFKTDELCHAYVHQSATSGRCTASLSFDGDTLYSYSTAIAKFITNKAGTRALIVNERSYSTTTAKHQSWLRRAIPSSLPVFWFEDKGGRSGRACDVDGSELFTYALEKAAAMETAAAKAKKDTTRASFTGDAAKWLERAAFISEFFKLRKKVNGDTLTNFRRAAELAEIKAAKARATDAQRHAERMKARQAEQQAAFDAWLVGEGSSRDFDPNLFPVAFRVETETERGMELQAELVSTLGARVPLSDAKRAFKFITSRRGQAWRENGSTCPVGPYKIQAISELGIVAGCHRISWDEIERLAPVLAESVGANPQGWESVEA